MILWTRILRNSDEQLEMTSGIVGLQDALSWQTDAGVTARVEWRVKSRFPDLTYVDFSFPKETEFAYPPESLNYRLVHDIPRVFVLPGHEVLVHSAPLLDP